jgi:hypothetical protein
MRIDGKADDAFALAEDENGLPAFETLDLEPPADSQWHQPDRDTARQGRALVGSNRSTRRDPQGV